MKGKDKSSSSDDGGRKKEMDGVAKHMRFTITTKKAIIKGENVEYFPGSKAVDCLMDSKWAEQVDEPIAEFIPYMGSRTVAADFCQRYIEMGYISRVNKIEVKGKEEREAEAAAAKKGGSKKKESVSPQASPRAKNTDRDEDGKKKKRKFRLQPHEHQKFIDSNEDFYVWHFNPPSRQSYLIGILVLIGAVAATLYPIWPQSSQQVIYYGSWLLLSLLGGLIGIFIVRLILFTMVWCCTMGKVHFWLFPNLNEDLGVIESFKPLYSIKKRKTKKSKKAKQSTDTNEPTSTGEVTETETTKENQKTSDDT